MHLSERLGLNKGCPATAHESEILSAFEQLFLDQDFLFLRWGPTITLTSDYGVTIISVSRTDRHRATVLLDMVPPPTLAPAQVKNVIASARAKQEGEQTLVVIARPNQPLLVVAEVEIQRPLSRDELSAVFSEFAFTTEVAIGEAIRGLEQAEEAPGDDAEVVRGHGRGA